MNGIEFNNYSPETGNAVLGEVKKKVYVGPIVGYQQREAEYAGFVARGGVASAKAYPNAMFPTIPTLEEAKASKSEAIDRRTIELIAAGFTYAGATFSMSASAQQGWTSLGAAHSLGLTSFPMLISTQQGLEYSLVDAAACVAFLAACVAFQVDPTKPQQWGRNLKDEVAQCATVAAVDAVNDPR